jgi:hypothetical protein
MGRCAVRSGPVQATPYGVYQVIGFSANGGVRLEARAEALRNPWRARLSAHLEAGGFRARLIGRVGIGAWERLRWWAGRRSCSSYGWLARRSA